MHALKLFGCNKAYTFAKGILFYGIKYLSGNYLSVDLAPSLAFYQQMNRVCSYRQSAQNHKFYF